MIIVAAVLGLLALFGLPALVGPARAWKARREAAVAARAAEAERQRQRQEHERQETERIWRETPDLAGLGEYLRYQHRMQTPLRHKVEAAEQQYSQRAQDVTARQPALRDGKPVTTPYRVLVFVGLGLFLAVFALAMALDYLIFHGLHPKGTWVLPLGLATLAVVGITVGSVVLLGGTRHRLIPENITPYGKRVVLVGAGLLVGGIVIAMAVIAPNRSYLGGQEQINTAVRQLSLDQTAQPPVGPDVISADNAAITQAKANLARAEQVDRLSAIVLALIEIPLSEAAILGAELLLFDAAVRRRDSAQQELAAAKQKLEGAQIFFMSELARILVAHGHDEDAVRQMRERYARLMLAWETQRSLPGGAPPGPGAGGAPPGPGPAVLLPGRGRRCSSRAGGRRCSSRAGGRRCSSRAGGRRCSSRAGGRRCSSRAGAGGAPPGPGPAVLLPGRGPAVLPPGRHPVASRMVITPFPDNRRRPHRDPRYGREPSRIPAARPVGRRSQRPHPQLATCRRRRRSPKASRPRSAVLPPPPWCPAGRPFPR